MKKCIFLIFLVLSMFFLCACNEMIENDENELNDVYLSDANLKFDKEIILGFDEPNFIERRNITPTEDGYYYISDDFLKFYDKYEGVSVPVCTQINCNHRSETCDAYYSFSQFRTELGMWYYDSKLFFIGLNDDRTEYLLWSVNLDGTERTKVLSLFKYEGETEDFIYSISLQRGHLYYTLSNQDYLKPPCIWIVEVKKNAKPSKIYTADINESYFYRFRGYGDGIFFQEGNLSNGRENFTASVKYLSSNGECYQVLNGPTKFYNIIDNKLYYTTDEGQIYVYDWNEDLQELFFDAKAICDISFDDNYIYLDNHYGVKANTNLSSDERQILCLSKTGELIHSLNIDRKASEACLFGDDKYLWMWMFKGIEDPSEIRLSIYDKRQIKDKGTVWNIVDTIFYE